MPIFDSIQLRRPKRNKFDLSHEKKLTLNMGQLVPIMVQEILPGDKFRVNSEMLIRFAPMLAPVMHRINVWTHYFFVPNRIIWDGWETHITGGADGKQSEAMPYVQMDEVHKVEFGLGSLADYMGLPTMDQSKTYAGVRDLNALPFRAYQTIYNEYYRDQNLEAKLAFGKGSGYVGVDQLVLTSIRTRPWEKDYFTSCLPWAQRGGDVLLPADIKYNQVDPLKNRSTGQPAASGPVTILNTSGTSNFSVNGNETVDVENVEGFETTINDLRRASRLQEWLEKNARGGARYVEQILSHFGVRSSDARLQRPEYLGGGLSPVIVSETLSTYTNTVDGIPQGNMAGHGISVGNTNGFRRSFEEHGFVIGIMSVLPKTAYQQGIHKMWRRADKYDYFWPEFAQLGEQEVMTDELFADLDLQPQQGTTFGYQSRYAEYKYAASSVHGDFRNSLAFWHMGRVFGSAPVLNESFIHSDPTQRIFAVTDPAVHKLYCQLYNKVDAIRPIPYFNTPTL